MYVEMVGSNNKNMYIKKGKKGYIEFNWKKRGLRTEIEQKIKYK